VQRVKDLAKASPDEEVCGVIVSDGGYMSVLESPNLYPVPSEGFLLSAQVMKEAFSSKKIEYVYHSHLKAGPKPTESDQLSCDETGFKYLIYSVELDKFEIVSPTPPWKALTGKSWVWGESDCLSLAMEYFNRVHFIRFSSPPRPDIDAFTKGSWEQFRVLGATTFHDFEKLPSETPLEISDVLAMSLFAKEPNHLAVYVGDSRILHHVRDELSISVILSDAWRRRIKAVYRHRKLTC
jgi:proteasome lid subunit RPN8/RPN11